MTGAGVEVVQQVLRRCAAIVLPVGMEYVVEGRLEQLARTSGYANVHEVLVALRSQAFGDLHRRLVEAFAVNETSFFRDGDPFELLRTDVIPRLIERGRTGLTVWSAAAASGQEAYSVAILMRDHFPELARRTTIVASDVSRPMLSRIDAGIYSSFELRRGLSPTQIARHFECHGRDSRVRRELRAMVDIRELNLAKPWPALPTFDIVLLRNVLVYFEPTTRRDVLRRVRETMAHDAALVVGATENLLAEGAR